MDARENALVAISRIPANSGHPLHKGTPREAFIREFLESHLPASLAIGTGEIIDANSQPEQQRNQFDIVIYKRSYPKLDFGGGISGFLIESVVATVEVKSVLGYADLEQAIKAARNVKALVTNVIRAFHAGYIPPKVLNFVVAYDGPAQMQTVYGWIPQIHGELGIKVSNLPAFEVERCATPAPSIDGVFVLNKGFLYFDNLPSGFNLGEARKELPSMKWVLADTASGSLLLLFLFLQMATTNAEGAWLDPGPYLSDFNVPDLKAGE